MGGDSSNEASLFADSPSCRELDPSFNAVSSRCQQRVVLKPPTKKVGPGGPINALVIRFAADNGVRRCNYFPDGDRRHSLLGRKLGGKGCLLQFYTAGEVTCVHRPVMSPRPSLFGYR